MLAYLRFLTTLRQRTLADLTPLQRLIYLSMR